MKKMAVLMLLLAFLPGCNYSFEQGEDLKLICSKILNDPGDFIYYLETQPENGVYTLGYGKLVALNYKTGEKYYLSKKSYHQNPVFSLKNKLLYFISTQGESETTINLLESSSPKKIYKLDLESGKLSVLLNCKQYVNGSYSEISHMQVDTDGDIYFSIYNSIIKYEINTKKLNYFLNLKDMEQINNFAINFDKWILLFTQVNVRGDRYLFEYDINKKSNKEIRKTILPIELGNWSKNNNNFILTDSVTLIYKMEPGSFVKVSNFGESKKKIVRDAFFLDDDILLISASQIEKDGTIRVGEDLYLYSLKDKKIIKQVTNDGFMKGEFFINN
jgi:hypothetical protein